MKAKKSHIRLCYNRKTDTVDIKTDTTIHELDAEDFFDAVAQLFDTRREHINDEKGLSA